MRPNHQLSLLFLQTSEFLLLIELGAGDAGIVDQYLGLFLISTHTEKRPMFLVEPQTYGHGYIDSYWFTMF